MSIAAVTFGGCSTTANVSINVLSCTISVLFCNTVYTDNIEHNSQCTFLYISCFIMFTCILYCT